MNFVNLRGEPLDMAKACTELASHPKAYPALPGGGPEGKTCRDCDHKRTCHSNSGRKSWVKCWLIHERWTSGPGTDIRAGSPACNLFKPKTKGDEKCNATDPASKP